MKPWTDLASHRSWLDGECRRLLAFGRSAGLDDGGAAYLDAVGLPEPEREVRTWITARTVHVYSLGAMLGVPGSAPVARRAMAGLTGRLRDRDHGGWYPSVAPDGTPEAGKSCYDHAFVLLGASSARLAGLDGATDLLDTAVGVFLDRFWDDDLGRCVDTWDTTFRDLDPYRGLNATMHAVEAMLAVGDVLDDPVWHQRAARVAEFVVALGRRHDHRLPEHFDHRWVEQPELNRDRPDHPFKPFGATVGHGLEWSRLLLHLEAALDVDAPAALLPTAEALFDRAVADGWGADGAEGFVYTTDWDGTPVVRERMHWVAAEAIGAAAALHARTGDARYASFYSRWWDHVAERFLDLDAGSWHHELDPQNRPAGTVWPGKPDLYHAVQSTLVPRLPLAPSIAFAVREGLLDAR